MTPKLTAALESDLGKSAFVTELTSLAPCLWDVEYSLENIDEVSNLFTNLLLSSSKMI